MEKKNDEGRDAKMFYSITEVAQILNIPASTLRYWEKELPSVNPRKSKGGTRKYTAEDIQELRLIYRLVKQEGHTIEGTKKRLERRRLPEMKKQDALDRLYAVRSELMGIIDELDKIIPNE